MLKNWNSLPECMKKEEVKKYYKELSGKRLALGAKRFLDVVLALILTVLLSPVMLILAICIKLDSKGPVFYRQERITQYGRPYRIFKFRTMVADADKKGPLVTRGGDSRITRMGRKLRSCRLDEIPQLFNVLKGDMNLIGPRPALYNQKDLMAERDKYGAGFVRPGITGLAQVMGRDELPIDVKARYDGIYTQHVGPVEDIFCLVRTVGVVLTSDGVVEGGTGKMEAKGSE